LSCLLYLAWCRFASGLAAAVVQMILFTGVAVFFTHNCEIGIASGRVVRARLQRLEDDIAAGTPLIIMAERHAGEVFPRDCNQLLQLLTNMRDARVGGFHARIYDAPERGNQVANTLTHSAEYYTNFVTQAYSRHLGRTPDAAGLSGWVGAMLSGS